MRWARGRCGEKSAARGEREREVGKPDPLTSFKGTALFIESNVHYTSPSSTNGGPPAYLFCAIFARDRRQSCWKKKRRTHRTKLDRCSIVADIE